MQSTANDRPPSSGRGMPRVKRCLDKELRSRLKFRGCGPVRSPDRENNSARRETTVAAQIPGGSTCEPNISSMSGDIRCSSDSPLSSGQAMNTHDTAILEENSSSHDYYYFFFGFVFFFFFPKFIKFKNSKSSKSTVPKLLAGHSF